MFARILHANDGSEGAAKALAAAVDLAERYGAELHMVCVEEVPYAPTTIGEVTEETDAARRRLEPVIVRAGTMAEAKGVTLKTRLVAGHPVRAILGLLEREGFDLLVVGFTGHGALYDRLIGSTADRLVQLAPCAVLVVK